MVLSVIHMPGKSEVTIMESEITPTVSINLTRKKPHIPPWKEIPKLSEEDDQTYQQFFQIYDKLFLPPKQEELACATFVKFLFEEWDGILPAELVQYIVSFLWRGEIHHYLKIKDVCLEYKSEK